MGDTELRSGACLCGAVRVGVRASKVDLGACHCVICQKWSGGPLFEIECGPNVAFEGAENISTYRSSNWARRGFCKECGTHLFVQSDENGDYGISPGLFADTTGLQFRRQVFVDQKPKYYSFANETLNVTSEYIHENFPETRIDE